MVAHFFSDWHHISFCFFPGLVPEAEDKESSDAAESLGNGAYLKNYWFASSSAPSQQQ